MTVINFPPTGHPYGDRPGDVYDPMPSECNPNEVGEPEPVHRNPLPRETLGLEAIALITGDRHDQHGPASLNLTNIGILLDAFSRIENPDYPISASAALKMALVKIARTQAGSHNDDDYRDGAGYMLLAGEEAGKRDPGHYNGA